jgi:hypothetical protein
MDKASRLMTHQELLEAAERHRVEARDFRRRAGFAVLDRGEYEKAALNCEEKARMLEKEADAMRYHWLRNRPLDSISAGGLLAGMTPENYVVNGPALDAEIDAAMAKEAEMLCQRPGCTLTPPCPDCGACLIDFGSQD